MYLLNPFFNTGIPSRVFEMDAGLVGSYSGGGSNTFANLVVAPADSSAQAAYDMYLGDTIVPGPYSPVFNGNAGDDSANEYFSENATFGFGSFRLPSASTFIQSLHKDGAIFSFYAFFKSNAAAFNADMNGLFGTYASTQVGMCFGYNSSGVLQIRMGNGSATQVVATGPTISGNTSYFVGVSYDETTGDGIIYLHDGSTNTVTEFNATYSSPSASDTTQAFGVGSANGQDFAGVFASKMQKWWRHGMFNVALNRSEFNAIYNLYKYKIGF